MITFLKYSIKTKERKRYLKKKIKMAKSLRLVSFITFVMIISTLTSTGNKHYNV